MSDFLRSVRLLCPWDSPGKNTGVGCHALSSRGSSRPGDWTLVSCGSCIAGGFFTTEPPGKPLYCVFTFKLALVHLPVFTKSYIWAAFSMIKWMLATPTPSTLGNQGLCILLSSLPSVYRTLLSRRALFNNEPHCTFRSKCHVFEELIFLVFILIKVKSPSHRINFGID